MPPIEFPGRKIGPAPFAPRRVHRIARKKKGGCSFVALAPVLVLITVLALIFG